MIESLETLVGLFIGRSKSIFPKFVIGLLMILGFIRSKLGFYNFKFESGYLKNNRTELDLSSYKSKSQAISSFRLMYGNGGMSGGGLG